MIVVIAILETITKNTRKQNQVCNIYNAVISFGFHMFAFSRGYSILVALSAISSNSSITYTFKRAMINKKIKKSYVA